MAMLLLTAIPLQHCSIITAAILLTAACIYIIYGSMFLIANMTAIATMLLIANITVVL